MDRETRKEPRRQINGTIQIQINPSMGETVQLEKQVVEVELLDISVDGIGLLTKTFLPKGTVVDLEFPGSALAVANAAPPPDVVRITAKIIYAKPQGDLCRMGLAITEMDEQTRSIIQAFAISRELRRTPRTPLP